MYTIQFIISKFVGYSRNKIYPPNKSEIALEPQPNLNIEILCATWKPKLEFQTF